MERPEDGGDDLISPRRCQSIRFGRPRSKADFAFTRSITFRSKPAIRRFGKDPSLPDSQERPAP